jgi:aspartyl-tRNA(Asn)/glutamyl-tRNA(Gln) amidotransferase subunit B
MSATAPTAVTQYETVIGLEVHVQLNTNSKLFSSAPNRFGAEPNQNASPICLGLPGVLPVLNQQALHHAIQLGLALNCKIAPITKFDRKQYFYPDLPKGYQISQYDYPVCFDGYMDLSTGRRVRILRAHLEEDAGKLVHAGADGLDGATHSLVDLNRAGTPLVEVVSEPDLRTADEAREYMQKLRSIVRYLGVCDGNLEEGSMRCDANVSIRPVGSSEYGTKAEVKNLNSFRSVQRAIESEVERQTALLRAGQPVVQESRLWNDATGTTRSMRSKEEAHDYRYFPDPDLRPVAIDSALVEQIRSALPELPDQRTARFISQFGLSDYDAWMMVENQELGDFLDAAAKHTSNAKTVTNLLMGDIQAWLSKEKKTLAETALTPEALGQVVALMDAGTIGSAQVKQLLPDLLANGGDPKALVESKGLAQISDAGALKPIIQKILDENPDNVAAYKSGKTKLMGFFVGQAMKATGGKANPEQLNQILAELLGC